MLKNIMFLLIASILISTAGKTMEKEIEAENGFKLISPVTLTAHKPMEADFIVYVELDK